MRLNATRLGSIASSRSFGDQLYDLAGQVPPLDLNFAGTKTLDPRVTHTRASSGTYVDSEGVIRTAVTNLLLRSEEFNNASWGGGASGNATVTPNAIAAPFGSITADLLDDTSTTQVQARSQVINIVSSTGSYTLSAFVRPNTSSIVSLRLGLGGATATNGEVVVDLATGAAQWRSGANVGTSFAITSAGGDWYRISVTVTDNGTGNNAATIELRPAFALTYTDTLNATAQGSAYFWGAQLEQSATVGEYIPTTSMINSAPRFDHDPVTGESLGLLVEEAGTNLMLSSEEFDSASWLGAVLTANTQVAPNGTTTADTLTATPGTPSFYQTVTCTASTAYTFSFYVKLGTMPASDFRFAVRDDTAGAFIATNIVPNVTPVTTEWRRVTYTLTTPVGCLLLRVYPYRSTIITGGTAFFWGAQLEAGAFATSYIPTTTATVTRAADVASISGANFSSWYRQDEGTVFVNGITPPNRANFPSLNTLHDGTSNNRLLQYVFTSGYFSAARVGSVPQGDNTAAVTPTDGSAYKVASAFAVNNSVTAVNGVTGSVDTLCLMPTALNTLAIGAEWNNANIVNSTIRRLTYWPTRLGNEVLQRITQP